MSGVSRPDRIAIIYLVYANRNVDRSVGLLRSIVGRMFGNCSTPVIIVDNASHACSADRSWTNGDLVISGDNRMHEFSGWERGYGIACDEFKLTNDDLILFANDTFDRQAHRGYLDALDRRLVENRNVRVSSIGYRDDLPRDARLLGLVHRWWFRSNIFIHPKATVDSLWPLCFPVTGKELFSDDHPGTIWNGSDLISENWKAYVSCWLYGACDPRFPEYKLVWHRAQPLTADNRKFFQMKALCILSEHYMGARLADLHVPVIDFNVLERTNDRHIGNYEKQFLERGAIAV